VVPLKLANATTDVGHSGGAEERTALVHKLCTDELQYSVVVLRPLQPDLPSEIRPRDRTHVEGGLETGVADPAGVAKLLTEPRRRRERRLEEYVAREVVVVGESKVGAIAEYAKIDAGLALRCPFGLDARLTLCVRREERGDVVLGCCHRSRPPAVGEAGAGIQNRQEGVRARLL